MKKLLKVNIMLFCIFILMYTLIDHLYLKQDIQWNCNLILAIIFSLIVSKLITTNN